MVKDADTAVDMARAVDKTGDVVKAADKAEDLYTTAKVDGTIQGFLDASDDPIAEMNKMSDSIAKTSPIAIPDNAVIKSQVKDGFYQIKYQWTDAGKHQIESRWHTRTPEAPIEQRDTWVVERVVPGVGAGSKHHPRIEQVRVGENEWITKKEWKNAIAAKKGGYATKQQEEWLDYGHSKI